MKNGRQDEARKRSELNTEALIGCRFASFAALSRSPPNPGRIQRHDTFNEQSQRKMAAACHYGMQCVRATIVILVHNKSSAVESRVAGNEIRKSSYRFRGDPSLEVLDSSGPDFAGDKSGCGLFAAQGLWISRSLARTPVRMIIKLIFLENITLRLWDRSCARCTI